MYNDFLIPSESIAERNEISAEDGPTIPPSRITRRSFIKRTGAAAVTTLVAWNATIQPVHASVASSDWDNGSVYLVCTVGPTDSKKNPTPVLDQKVMGHVLGQLIVRKKYDNMLCKGPCLGDAVPASDTSEARFTMSARVVSSFQQNQGTTIGTLFNRRKTVTQDIVVTDREIVWRTPATCNNYPGNTIAGSAASGGVGLQHGTAKAKTSWADFDFTGTTEVSLTSGGAAIKFNIIGDLGTEPMTYTASDVQWQFELMTEDQLDAFLMANWSVIHSGGCNPDTAFEDEDL